MSQVASICQLVCVCGCDANLRKEEKNQVVHSGQLLYSLRMGLKERNYLFFISEREKEL